MSKRTQTMGGTATTQFIPEINGWLVAMTGDFDGAAYARVVGEPREMGGGKMEYDLEHFFVRKDGSTISTKDKALTQSVDGNPRLLGNTTYKVVKATGAFEGMTGEFQSWGSFDPATGQGILRFWGQIGDE